MTTLDAATEYARRKWRVIPVPFRSKKPTIKGWPQLRIETSDLPHYFNGSPSNIGVLLGEPSGWLVDVDLDHALCIELAVEFLPRTTLVFGRESKRRSHLLFRTTSPVATLKRRSKSAGMLVELRSTGTQTVIPPSIHESGEPIEWEDENAEPALIDPVELTACVNRLADAVLIQLGEKRAPKPLRTSQDPTAVPEQSSEGAAVSTPDGRVERCYRAVCWIGIQDKRDGSLRLYTAACRCVEFDLDEGQSIALIRRYEARSPFPRRWSDHEIRIRLGDAEKVCRRGSALEEPPKDEEGLIRLGHRDPESGRFVLSPKRTLPTGKAFLQQFYSHPDRILLIHYADVFYTWTGNRYVPIEVGELRSRIHPWLHEAVRYIFNRSSKENELIAFDANPTTVSATVETVKALTHSPADLTVPRWLDDNTNRPSPLELLPCRSSILHLPSGNHIPNTPNLLNFNGIDYDYDPNASVLEDWLGFLGQLFEDDLESLDLLQEWFGYCLTPDTSQQKMLLIVGPRRSGKGTIGRVLTHLVGAGNVCGPTISSLGGAFGLQSLIGKSLAIVSDARFAGEHIQTVVERLLCISGEDTLTIDRKHLPGVTMRLPTRLMFLTNELPRLAEASGALTGRFLILRLTKSFYGMENTQLTQQMLKRLPAILNWSIEGWNELNARGYFVQPSSVTSVLRDLEDLSSPVSAFVRDRCELAPVYRAWIDQLYNAWKQWCEADGRMSVSIKQVFGRDLLAAFPEITRHQDDYGRFYRGIRIKD